jgi:hypothetical protein
MLLVFFPAAVIAGAFDVGVDALAVGFVVEPFAVVDISISMEELALTAGLVELPLTVVSRRVGPYHNATTVTQATLPLALVGRACFVSVNAVVELRGHLVHANEGLFGLVALEVFALDFTGHFLNAVLASLEEASDSGLDSGNHFDVVF